MLVRQVTGHKVQAVLDGWDASRPYQMLQTQRGERGRPHSYVVLEQPTVGGLIVVSTYHSNKWTSPHFHPMTLDEWRRCQETNQLVRVAQRQVGGPDPPRSAPRPR